jgi:tetratricopeptide (TPR) repeat protein
MSAPMSNPLVAALGRAVRGRPAQVWAGLLAALGVALVAQPLVGFARVLGYEYALVMAEAVSLATLHVAAWLVTQRRASVRHPVDRPLGAGEAILAPWAAATLLGWGLSAGPLLVALVGAAFVRNCDLSGGLVFWLGFPLASAPLAAMAGVWAGLVAPSRYPRLGPALAAWLVVLASAAWEFGRFYTAPIVFFYDPFGGFASGQGWDRSLGLGAPFLWYRLYCAAAFGAAGLLAAALVDPARLRLAWPWRLAPERRRTRAWLLAAAAAAGAAAAALDASGGSLGFRPTAAYSAGVLAGDLVTEHLHLRFDRGAHGDEAPLIAADLEFRWDELRAFFGGRAPRYRIAVWLYGTGEQKRRLFGTANTDMAKPWRTEVHLGPSDFPHGVAMHEMAHVFAGEMARGPFNVPGDFGFYVSMGLVEGVAVAATFATEGHGNELTDHEWSAAMRRAGFAPPIASLVTAGGFLKSYPSTSYTAAGSFVRFLVDTYGMDRFAAVYGGDGFERAYGKSVEALGAEWGAAMDAVPLAPWALDVARFRFDRPSILHAVCYHEIPALSADAAKLAKDGRVDEAVAAYRKICTYEPDEPAHRMAIFNTLVGADRYKEARAEAAALAAHPKMGEVSKLELAEDVADLDWREGNVAAAAAGYAAVAKAHRSESADRRLAIKRAALEAGGKVAAAMREYLLEEDGRPPALTLLLLREACDDAPGFAPAFYLLGYRLAGLGEHARAVPYLEKALALGLPHPSLAREARWRLGEALFRQGRLDDAAVVFRALDAAGEPEAVRLTARDWLARIDWWKRNPARACPLPLPKSGAGGDT